MKAYQLSWKAESLCSQLYPSSQTNDGSDACRHFIWSALLVNHLKEGFAKQALLAHENEPTQPKEELAMDSINNHRGILTARKLIKSSQFNEENLLQAFKNELSNGKLKILRK